MSPAESDGLKRNSFVLPLTSISRRFILSAGMFLDDIFPQPAGKDSQNWFAVTFFPSRNSLARSLSRSLLLCYNFSTILPAKRLSIGASPSRMFVCQLSPMQIAAETLLVEILIDVIPLCNNPPFSESTEAHPPRLAFTHTTFPNLSKVTAPHHPCPKMMDLFGFLGPVSWLCFHCWPNITTTHTSSIEMKTGHAQASLLVGKGNKGGWTLMVLVHALRPAHYRTRGVLFENNKLSTTFSVRAFHLIALVLLTIGSSQLSARSFRWQH